MAEKKKRLMKCSVFIAILADGEYQGVIKDAFIENGFFNVEIEVNGQIFPKGWTYSAREGVHRYCPLNPALAEFDEDGKGNIDLNDLIGMECEFTIVNQNGYSNITEFSWVYEEEE